ncbi:Imm53 family immunity protein [Actinoplanes rectilineatus]|uniref:Imm53 family immunity protein n=1 Tax=Actinoplanes rectilineatus TaxID=113571 RepID=UPI0009F8B738|nr:Imm53 family immunity protein [Actinoplanes rectilineatus]
MADLVLSDDEGFGYVLRWYSEQCDGDWEHEFGIRLESLDNPGWNLRIDIGGTDLEGVLLAWFRRDYEVGRWMMAYSDGVVFEANCDPSSLYLAVDEFKRLVDTR